MYIMSQIIQISTPFNSLIIGSYISGKSTLCCNIAKQCQFDKIFVFTSKENLFYYCNLPNAILYGNYTPQKIEKICKEHNIKEKTLIILDEYSSIFNEEKLQNIINGGGKNFNISTILISQSMIEKSLRVSIDYLFITTSMPYLEKQIYEKFFVSYMSFDEFMNQLKLYSNEFGQLGCNLKTDHHMFFISDNKHFHID